MTPTRHLFLGMVLTAAAGFVDAIGFIELGGYFISFMSGNTTQGAAALVDGAWPIVLLATSLVALFFIGSVVGTLLAQSSPGWGLAAVSGAVFLAVSLSLGLVTAGWPAQQAMLVLAASAGAQNAILPMRGAVRLGATFVTGTLYAAGQDLAFALRRKAPAWRWTQHLVVWLGLCGGAAFGALLLPAAIYLGFTLGHLRAARPT